MRTGLEQSMMFFKLYRGHDERNPGRGSGPWLYKYNRILIVHNYIS